MTASLPASAADPGAAPLGRRLWRALVVALLVAYFLAGGLFLVVREFALPRVEAYRPQIAAAVGRAIGLSVSIDALSADWSGLRPRLHLSGLLIRDRAGRPALRLDKVDATVGWSSLLRGRPYFHRLEVLAPELALRRERSGEIFVAGIRIDPGASSGGGFSEWLLAQREIVIRDAALTWSDEQRGAPELRLADVDFRLTRRGERYRFGLRAEPAEELGSALDLRGDLVGAAPEDIASWTGQLYVALDRADLGGWRPWLDYPVELLGSGGVRAWVGVAGGEIRSVAANLALDGVTTRLAEDLPRLELASLRGQLSGRREPSRVQFSTRGLTFVTGDGLRVEPTDIDAALLAGPDGQAGEGTLKANRLDLFALARLASHLPFDQAVRDKLAAFDPRGALHDLRFDWRGPAGEPTAWNVEARFTGLGLDPHGLVPGMSGISGELDGDEQGGRFRLSGQNAALELPAVFPEPRIALATLSAEGGWARREGRPVIQLDQLAFENADAAGSGSGSYVPVAGGRGEIDLAARLSRAEGTAVWRYLPHVVNEETRSWLRESLTGGLVPDARLRLKGNLDEFPFTGGRSGQFLVTARVSGASLAYAPGWPAIGGIDGQLRFEGPSMRIEAERGRILGVALGRVAVEVPRLDAAEGPVMTLRGRAGGPTADFLRFVAESPVAGWINGFTDGMRSEGPGELDLTLAMPLSHIGDTRVKGEFRFSGNRLHVLDGLPAVAEAAGAVQFTERGLSIREARGRLFGEPVVVSAHTPDEGGVSLAASGGANLRAVREAYGWPLLEHLSGTGTWRAKIDVRGGGAAVTVRSDLAGVASSLPEPLNKSALAHWPLTVDVTYPAGAAREELRVRLAERATFELARRGTADGWVVERGGLGLLAPVRTAEYGVRVNARLDEIDVDAWRQMLDASETASTATAGAPAWPFAGATLQAQRVTLFGHSLSNVRLSLDVEASGWKGRIASQEAEGTFDWSNAAEGALRARFRHLFLGSADEPESAAGEAAQPPRRLPGLDIVAERFALRGMDLGRLELQARNRDGRWDLDALSLASADARLTGSGRWLPGDRPRTELDFRLETPDAGRLLARLGYPAAVQGGRATMDGKVEWRGAPTRLHYPSLSGAIDLDVRRGQFRELEPGVGRLLGVLSLQALPRRLSLDFRDVFSEGFAFDDISGSIALASGVLRTENLTIRGPAAKILMKGSADVAKETQNLHVTVQPTLAESVAIGAAAGLINPVAGVVTYFAQKALSDPIERFFAFDYAVTGSWSDPKVEKLSGPPAAPPAAQPEIPSKQEP